MPRFKPGDKIENKTSAYHLNKTILKIHENGLLYVTFSEGRERHYWVNYIDETHELSQETINVEKMKELLGVK